MTSNDQKNSLKNQIYIAHYQQGVFDMVMGCFEDKLCLFNYRDKPSRSAVDKRIQRALNAEFVEQETPLLEQARQQMDAYLAGELIQFDLPLLLLGTEFQKSVWQALLAVPYGETASYLELAQAINKPTACRAVANANRANALSMIIPCHRIIGRDGTLVGYGGGLERKQALLDLEYKRVNRG